MGFFIFFCPKFQFLGFAHCSRTCARFRPSLIFTLALAASLDIVFDVGGRFPPRSGAFPLSFHRCIPGSATGRIRERAVASGSVFTLVPSSFGVLPMGMRGLLPPLRAAPVPGAGGCSPGSAAFGARTELPARRVPRSGCAFAWRGSGLTGWLRQRFLAPPGWLHRWPASPPSFSEQACCCPASSALTFAEELVFTSPRPR